MSSSAYEISKVLAALAYYKKLVDRGKGVNYNYIDKLANASSKDMALYHLREALRDFDTLKNNDEDMKKALSLLESKAGKIDYSKFEAELDSLEKARNLSDLRQMLSRIGVDAINLGNEILEGDS
ncbi:MAG: type I-A CRISPR-associated protein Csa5 [Nitrososphaeria archaeon]